MGMRRGTGRGIGGGGGGGGAGMGCATRIRCVMVRDTVIDSVRKARNLSQQHVPMRRTEVVSEYTCACQ